MHKKESVEQNKQQNTKKLDSLYIWPLVPKSLLQNDCHNTDNAF